MKREFLQNFKVGDQPLTPEIIDAIMAENGRDIEAAKKPFADYDSIKEQLQTAKDGLKAFEGVDVAQLQSQITTLNTQLSDKDKEWQWKRFVTHMEEKYSINGYIKLWIPHSPNENKLKSLREVIANKSLLRQRFDAIYDKFLQGKSE